LQIRTIEILNAVMGDKILTLKTRGSQWTSVTEDKYLKKPKTAASGGRDTFTIFWDVFKGAVQSQPQMAHPVPLNGIVKHWKS